MSSFAQADTIFCKNTIYIGGGRQGLTYLKYERLLYNHSWTQTVTNFGIGGRPGDIEIGEHRLLKIMPDIIQLFGYKWIFAEIGIEPSINFQGSLTYIELNGIIGIRYQNRINHRPSFFAHIGYNPRLYRTHFNDIYVPFYFGLGINF